MRKRRGSKFIETNCGIKKNERMSGRKKNPICFELFHLFSIRNRNK